MPDTGSIFHIKNQWNILVIGNYFVNHQSSHKSLVSSSDTRLTLMRLFLFTITAQRELVSICRQSIRNSNWLSLHYYLDAFLLKLINNPLNQEIYRPGTAIYVYCRREGTPRHHELSLCRHKPARFARQTEPPLCRPSLCYADHASSIQ